MLIRNMKLLHYPETDVKECASEDKIVLAIFTGRVPLTVFVFSARIFYWRKISRIVIVWRTLSIVIHLIAYFYWPFIKGSSGLNHFIFEIKVGKKRIRHRTTLNFNS